MTPVSVDCTFDENGAIRVRRIRLEGQWQPVEQGRQWTTDEGRCVLIMLPGETARRLLLRASTLAWELWPLAQRAGDAPAIVA